MSAEKEGIHITVVSVIGTGGLRSTTHNIINYYRPRIITTK